MGNSKSDIQHKSLKQIIPKIYKRQWLEGVLFGWIRANKTLVPSITIEQAVKSFYKDQDISEDDFPMADCITTYQRMTKEYYESLKDTGE
jgi:hypothetical protein